jgi:hypothetical protein
MIAMALALTTKSCGPRRAVSFLKLRHQLLRRVPHQDHATHGVSSNNQPSVCEKVRWVDEERASMRLEWQADQLMRRV